MGGVRVQLCSFVCVLGASRRPDAPVPDIRAKRRRGADEAMFGVGTRMPHRQVALVRTLRAPWEVGAGCLRIAPFVAHFSLSHSLSFSSAHCRHGLATGPVRLPPAGRSPVAVPPVPGRQSTIETRQRPSGVACELAAEDLWLVCTRGEPSETASATSCQRLRFWQLAHAISTC